MKLYYAPRTRANRVRWTLEELGVPYELVPLNLGAGEHRSPEYLSIHPRGRVPAFVDGDVVLYESGAICMYLADRFASHGLAPAIDSPLRGAYYNWLALAMAELDPTLATIFGQRRLGDGERSPVIERQAIERWQGDLLLLESTFVDGRHYLLGADFSVADVLVGSVVLWARSMGLCEAPQAVAYAERLVARPAYQRAIAAAAAAAAS